MDFKGWLNESTVNDLYNSTVDAFPKTTLRQHAIDPIRITQFSVVPYKGFKSIYFKGLAQNEGREYHPIVLFKDVSFYNEREPNTIQIMADDGRAYNFEVLSPARNDVLLRCECKDFYWRFNYYDHLDHSLHGRKRKKYEGNYRINPKELPGMCKHLIKFLEALRDAGILLP